MVLIISDQFDSHADYIVKKLKDRCIPYFRFNVDVEELKQTYVTFDGESWNIRTQHGSTNTDDFHCVWCRRPFVELTLQEQAITDVDFKIWKNEWNKTLLGIYNTLKNRPWLNPLRKAYKGENKYYQMELAKEIGFSLPETIISNDRIVLEGFINKQETALFKLMSQEMYELGNNDFRGLYTNIITIEDLKNFNVEEENPIVVQKYIEKQYEVRYTVVGRNHLVCRIESQESEKAKNDWRRYDIANTPHHRIDPPIDIKRKVYTMMEKMGLEYGALDFIVTPDEEWVFLEINCMGQWLWIEQLTGLPISDAIVDWIKSHITGGCL